MLTVTGSERLRKSCSCCLGAVQRALYLPTGSCNWYGPDGSLATSAPLASRMTTVAPGGVTVPVTTSAVAADAASSSAPAQSNVAPESERKAFMNVSRGVVCSRGTYARGCG